MKNVLIAGGSGLVGKALFRLLKSRGYELAVLSRSRNSASENKSFYWNPAKAEIDESSLLWADVIVQLAGANIGSERWSNKRKKEIVESRVQSTQLLYNTIKQLNTPIEAFISASAIGIYGAQTSEHIFNEEDAKGEDFLAKTCIAWEEVAEAFQSIGTRTVKLRTGVVLSSEGGALQKMILPFKLGLGSALGTGQQYLPWIHIEDLTLVYLQVINNSNMKGAFNAVAPEYVTNISFSKMLAKSMKRWFFMPKIPAWVLSLALGEMSVLLLEGSRVSSEKLVSTGFEFKYASLDKAFEDLV